MMSRGLPLKNVGGLLSFSKIPLCIHESTFLWVERKRGVHILLFLGYFFLHRRTSIHGHLLMGSICISQKDDRFLPIFSKFLLNKFLSVFMSYNSLYWTIKGLLMAKKDSECLDQGQGCKLVFLTFG